MKMPGGPFHGHILKLHKLSYRVLSGRLQQDYGALYSPGELIAAFRRVEAIPPFFSPLLSVTRFGGFFRCSLFTSALYH